MSALRCENCNLPLTQSERATGICPMCGNAVAWEGDDAHGLQRNAPLPAVSVRPYGLMSVLAGLVMTAVGIWLPLSEAKKQVPNVTITLWIMAVPLLFGVGMIWLVGGARGAALIGKPYSAATPGWLGLLMLLLFAVAGVVLYFWLRHVLASYGYQ